MNLTELTACANKLFSQYQQESIRNGKTPWSAEDLMKGFVVDVGDLMRLVMAQEGKRSETDVQTRLAHELADCLWSVLLLAKSYGIDLEKELLHMVESRMHSIS